MSGGEKVTRECFIDGELVASFESVTIFAAAMEAAKRSVALDIRSLRCNNSYPKEVDVVVVDEFGNRHNVPITVSMTATVDSNRMEKIGL